MVTAIDTSVLLDVLLDDENFADISKTALRTAVGEGSLIIGEVVIAELVPVLSSSDLSEFIRDWHLQFIPSSLESALLAGSMYRTYLKRTSKPVRVVPDFLVGAHAQTHAQRLLARDRGFYRDYFKSLKVWDPTERAK